MSPGNEAPPGGEPRGNAEYAAGGFSDPKGSKPALTVRVVAALADWRRLGRACWAGSVDNIRDYWCPTVTG